MPRKKSTFYLSQQLAYLVDCQGDRAHGLQLLEAIIQLSLHQHGAAKGCVEPIWSEVSAPRSAPASGQADPILLAPGRLGIQQASQTHHRALSYFFLRKHSDMIFSPSVGNVNIYEMGANCLNFL